MEVRWHDLWRIRHGAPRLLYAVGIDGMSEGSLHRSIIYGLVRRTLWSAALDLGVGLRKKHRFET